MMIALPGMIIKTVSKSDLKNSRSVVTKGGETLSEDSLAKIMAFDDSLIKSMKAESILAGEKNKDYSDKKIILKTVNEKGEKIKTITVTEHTTQEKPDFILFIFRIIHLIGIVLFIMAKEKCDDERLEKLRLVAYRDTFIFLFASSIIFIGLEYIDILKLSMFMILSSTVLFYLVRYILLKRK